MSRKNEGATRWIFPAYVYHEHNILQHAKGVPTMFGSSTIGEARCSTRLGYAALNVPCLRFASWPHPSAFALGGTHGQTGSLSHVSTRAKKGSLRDVQPAITSK